ncbi:hypothetical protein HJD18_01315 [Thermoleophilia bacterium SCSIO 60948]|nr:hypothetical protein HJD18_01315 [Thermoleophilia bacterium SCSIO 60948]
MFEAERIEEWRGADVYDAEGEKIGKLEDFFEDRQTGRHVIGTVKTGLFGRKLSLVPLDGATVGRSFLRVTVSKDQVKGAPQADSGGLLDDAGAAGVFRHFGHETPIGSSGDGSGGPRYEATSAREAREAEAKQKAERADELARQAEAERQRAMAASETAEGSASAATEAESESTRLRREAAELRGEALAPAASTPPEAQEDRGAEPDPSR